MVMDNLNIHCQKTLADHFGEEWGTYLWNRLTLHYTPKHGSWVSQAEIAIGPFARQSRGRRRISSLAELRREAAAWNRQVNREKFIINWKFTRKTARERFSYHKTSFTRS